LRKKDGLTDEVADALGLVAWYNACNVPAPQPQAQTFLLRLWIEQTAEEKVDVVWRGRITHLPDEEHLYVQGFDEIRLFVCGYLLREGWLGGPGETE
jgi:hypothetical protein